MAAFEIRESDTELLIRSESKYRIWLAIAAGAAATILLTYAGIIPQRSGLTQIVGIGVTIAIVEGALFSAMGTAELRVSPLEFLPRAGRQRSSKSVATADVKRLRYEWRESGRPAGLYAELDSGAICLLPYVDAVQGAQVISRIHAKFPSAG